MDRLVKWKQSAGRMPLILEGARQVGKTWLMQEFGSRYFQSSAYVNLENNAIMQEIFQDYSNTDRIISAISAYCRTDIVPGETLIILDEVQEVPYAVSSLKYFQENAPEYPVIAAGSLLGIKYPEPRAPYPVGKVDKLRLHPMSFTEYLLAAGENQFVEWLLSRDIDMLQAFESRLVRHLGDYYYIGGMPRVVSTYLDSHDYHQARNIQLQIIDGFEYDIAKHLNSTQASRARTLWQSVPMQLGREQGKRFLFSELAGSGRARDFKDALQWLIDAKLVTKVRRVAKPGIPLMSYASDELFELFLLDVGLYSAMVELDIESVLVKNSLFTEGKGGLSEQFVCQQLIAEFDVTPFYWASSKTPAQVDFIVSHDGSIYPIEVKAATNLRSKSLRAFSETYGLHGYRFSLAGYKEQDWLTNIPLYAVSLLLEKPDAM